MKNRNTLVILLFILPLLVVLIASGPSGVMVFDGEVMTYYPWLQLLSNSSVGWCAPVAALLNYALFVIAVFYALKKKSRCLKAIRNIAAIAGCLAVLPNLVRADVMVVPNVFGAIALFADAIVAVILMKKDQTNQKIVTQGKRLDRH